MAVDYYLPRANIQLQCFGQLSILGRTNPCLVIIPLFAGMDGNDLGVWDREQNICYLWARPNQPPYHLNSVLWATAHWTLKYFPPKPSGGNVFKAFEQRMATWKSFLFLFVFLFLLFQRPRHKNFIKNPKCNTVLCNTSQRQCHW